MNYTYYNARLAERARIDASRSNNTCNFTSYYSRNYKKNIDYSIVLGKPSSIIYGKPITNTCYSSRALRLRILLK